MESRSRNPIGFIWLACLLFPVSSLSSALLPGTDVINQLSAAGNGSLTAVQVRNESLPESSNISDISTESPYVLTATTSGSIIEDEFGNQTTVEESESKTTVQESAQDDLQLKNLKHGKGNDSMPLNIIVLGLTGEEKLSVLQNIIGHQFIQPVFPDSDAFITEYFLANTSSTSRLRIVDTPAITGHSQNASHDARIFATVLDYYSESSNLSPLLILIALPLEAEGENRRALFTLLQRTAILREAFAESEKETNSPATSVLIVQINTNQDSSTEEICPYSESNTGPLISLLLHEQIRTCFIILLPRLKGNGVRLQPCNCSSDINKLQLEQQLNLPFFDSHFSSDDQNSNPYSHFVNQTYPLTNNSDLAGLVMRMWAADEVVRAQPPTEVNIMLEANYAKLDLELRRKYPGSLQLLQKQMLTRNVTRRGQVPNELRRLLHNSTDLNPAMLALLQAAFPVVVPEIHFEPLVGKGYDPITDSPVESPFTFDSMEFCKLGFMLPKSIRMTLILRSSNAEVNHIKFHISAKSLVASRMKELNVTIKLNETSFGGEFRPGDILLSLFKNTAVTRARITATREIHKFQFTLNRDDVKFKPEFLDQIATMPAFSVHDRDSVQEWKVLLDEYGTHVVTSAFGGGYLEVMIELKNHEFRLFQSGNVTAVRRVLESVLSNPVQFVNSNSNLTVLSLSAKGGGVQYHDVNLMKLNRTVMASTLESWKNSLIFDPIMVETRLKLVPLSEFVRRFNASAASELTKAARAVFEGNLRYILLPQPKPPSPSPVQSVRTSTGSDHSDQLNQKLKRAEDSVLPPRTSAGTSVGRPSGPIISTVVRNLLPTREQFEQNNKLLECLQAFIASLDAQIQQSPDDSTLAPLANDIEQLYNQIANTGTANTRERLLIEVICLNFSKTQSLPLEQLKNLVQFPEDLRPETKLPPVSTAQPPTEDMNGFPQLHTAKLRSTDANLMSRMKNIAGSVWQLDGLPKPQRQITDYRFIGYGYDLLWDEVTSHSPFLLTENSYNKVNMRSFPRPEVVFQYFTSKSECIAARWRTLVSSSFRQFMPSKFRGRLQPGQSYAESDYVSIVLEYRKSLVRLPVNEPHHLRLSEDFRNELGRLPLPFDSNNCTFTNAWKRFLNRYGTHIVIEAFLGGGIEVRGSGRLKESLLQLRGVRSDEVLSALKFSCTATMENSDCTFRVTGGNSSIFTSWNVFDSEQFESWIASIPSNLVVLPSSIKLKNLYHIITNSFGLGSVSFVEVGTQFLANSNAYHSGELTACRGSTRCRPFESYNETSNSCTCPAGQIRNLQTGSCEALVGHNCSPSSWDNCIQNAICAAAATPAPAKQDGSSVCKCRHGYETLPSGKCSVSSSDPDRQSCHTCIPTTLHTNATMTCNSEGACGNFSFHVHSSMNKSSSSQVVAVSSS